MKIILVWITSFVVTFFVITFLIELFTKDGLLLDGEISNLPTSTEIKPDAAWLIPGGEISMQVKGDYRETNHFGPNVDYDAKFPE
jgi:hypothetical protein